MKVSVLCFATSLDGYGAGPHQDLQNPLGVGGPAMFEWFSAASIRASRSNRASRSASRWNSSGSALIATSRWSLTSRAR